MSLKFNERAHRYWLDGKPVPGVTTLLSGGLPKPALPRWAAKTVAEYVADNLHDLESWGRMGRDQLVAALKQKPWTDRNTAAARGTEVHALAEKVVHGEEVAVPEHLHTWVEGYARLLDTHGIEPIVTEVPVAHRGDWYAGKPDAIVRMGGETWLLDWKTSKSVYGETALQTAAYARAEFYAPTPDDEQPMPHIDRIGVVHITATESVLYPLGDIDEAFKTFRHVAYIAKRADWIKGLIGDPYDPKGSAA